MQPEHTSQSLRRPLIGLALAFAAGTWCAAQVGGLSLSWLGAIAAGLLMLSLAAHGCDCLIRRNRPVVSIFNPAHRDLPRLVSGLAAVCLYLAVVAIAWYAACLRLVDPSPSSLAALMEKPRESVEVEGIVADDPAARPSADGARQIWNFPLRLEAIRRLVPWQQARGSIQVFLPVATGEQRPRYGDRWCLAGVLTDNARFPEDDYAVVGNLQSPIRNPQFAIGHPVTNRSRPVLDWLNRHYTFRADPDFAVCQVPGQGSFLMAACFHWRRQCAAGLALGIEHRPEVAGLLQALLLGYRQELSDKLRNDFTVTGTYHIFAISGQHVAILALFIIVVLQSYRVSRVKWFLYVAPLLVVFTLSTGMSASAVRGCLMALLCFLGPLVGRKPDIPSALALAALIILAVDPFQLFDYGFLLSFVAVIGLVVLCPPLLRRVAPAVEPDPLRLQPEPKLTRWIRLAMRAIVFLFVSSLAAWLVTTPLVARWFNMVSPVALLANLIVIPVTTFVLLAGCLAILFGWAVPVLGEIFNFANLVLVSFLLWVTDLMARLPYGHFFVRSPPLWSLALWYGVLAGWVVWRRQRWIWFVGPLLLALALGAGLLGARPGLEVDLLNAGDRPVCFVKARGGDGCLIDTGSRYQVRKVIRCLRRQGVNRLQAVVLTGVDSEHAGGMPEILRTMPVRELWLPPGATGFRALRATLASARANGAIVCEWRDAAQVEATPSSLFSGSKESRVELQTRQTPEDSAISNCVRATGIPAAGPGRFNSGYITLNTGSAPVRLFVFRGENASAWLLRRGALSVLLMDGTSTQLLAAVRAHVPDLKPAVLVENRMSIEAKSGREALAGMEIQPGWRVLCVRSALSAGDEWDASLPDRLLRCAPGQGILIRMDDDHIRLEQLGL
jgi:ComEC/Rec2-related protein